MAKSNFNKAATKARNADGTITEEDKALMVLNGDMSLQADTLNVEELARLVASGEMEAAEEIMEIAEGQVIRGQLIGPGTEATLDDLQNPGKTRQVKTWKMKLVSGVTVTFLGSAELDRKLPPFLGRKGQMLIGRGGQAKTKKGKNLTHWYVVGPGVNAPKLENYVAATAESLTE